MLKSFLISLIFCQAIAIVVLALDEHFQNEHPPREYHGAQSSEYKEPAQPERNATILKIECDPNCRYAESQNEGYEDWVRRIIQKSINDPIAIFSGLLVIVTALLVWVSIRTVQHFRVTERAYIVGGGSRTKTDFWIDVGNYGRTNAELLSIEWGF